MIVGRVLMALSAVIALVGCASRETLQASFDHSEWHPSSMLRLDVASGGFVARFYDGTLANGRFSPEETRRIQALIASANAAGFTDPLCHTALGRIVVSNGGVRTLVLHSAGRRWVPPKEEGCWSAEIETLHRFIEHTLYERGDQWTMPWEPRRLGPMG